MANFESKKIFVIVLLIVAISGILFILNGGRIPSLGITTLGACTQPNFISNDSFFNNQTYQCTFAPGGKYLQFTITPNDALSLFGVKTEQNIIITEQVIKDQCTMQFSNISDPIYSFYLQTSPSDKFYNTQGTWQCTASIANPPYSSSTFTDKYGLYLATTPFKCYPPYLTSEGSCQSTTGAIGCDSAWRKEIGRLYKIDPTSIRREFAMQINLTIGTKTYTALLTDKNTSVAAGDVFRDELIANLAGSSTCGIPDIAAYVQNSQTTNPLKYVTASSAQNVINQNPVVQDLNSAIINGNDYNSKANAMLSSQVTAGQYGTLTSTPTTSILTTSLSYSPVVGASIPLNNFYINAKYVGVIVPSGKPKILNVTAQPASASQRSDVSVTFTNLAEKDTFLASINCPKISPQVFSIQTEVATNEIKTVNIPTQYAGSVDSCTVSVKSINSPQNTDSSTVNLIYYPYCTRQSLTAAQTLVNTEFGCSYICPNYGNISSGKPTDVLDGSCQPITTYDRCTYTNGTCISKLSYNGIHCTGIGTYLNINDYLDQVNSGKMQPFTPTQKPHQYFIVSSEGKAVCNYINEFGYVDGALNTQTTFDYSKGFPEATPSTITTQPSTVPSVPTTPQPYNPQPQQPNQPTPSDNTIFGLQYPIVIILIIIIAAIGYLILRRRK